MAIIQVIQCHIYYFKDKTELNTIISAQGWKKSNETHKMEHRDYCVKNHRPSMAHFNKNYYITHCIKYKNSVRIKIGITSIFQVSLSSHSICCVRSCRPFVILTTSSVGLVGCQSSFSCPAWVVDETSTAQAGQQKKFRHPTRPADVNKLTKGLQEWTQQIEWDDDETWK